MAQDQFEVEPQPPETSGPEKHRSEKHGPGRLVFTGVLAACVLGAGFGLWARPTSIERGAPRPAKQAVAPPNAFAAGTIQIVVDDTPAPIGRLLEVLPAQVGEAVYAAAREPVAADPPPVVPIVPAEPVAPRRAPSGLMKVADPIDPPEAAEPARVVAKRAPPPPKAKPVSPKVQKAKVEKPKAKAERPRVAKAVAKPKKAPEKDVRQAKAEKRKAEKAKLAKAEAAKTAKARKTELAQAEARDEARKKRAIAQLVRVVKATPKKLREEVRVAERKAEKTRLAKLEATKAEKARAAKVRKDKARKTELAKAAPPKPKPARVQPRGEGPLRQVRNDRCLSADPGETLVCADPRLSVRERQMQRAYRDAEAAGVPADQLRRQQQRWLSARAAAAREAPWAVEEVYEARIAELNDQSRSSDY